MMKPAPAATFLRSLRYCGMTSRSWRLWLVTVAPRKNRVGSNGTPPGRSGRRPAFMSEYIRRRPIESMSKTGAAPPR